jgi:hypothetical protein
MAQQPLVLIIEASLSHWDTPHLVALLWTSDQPDAEASTWQHTTLKRHIHAPGGIRTRNSSKWAAADSRLRLRGHWDRRLILLLDTNYSHDSVISSFLSICVTLKVGSEQESKHVCGIQVLSRYTGWVLKTSLWGNCINLYDTGWV